MAELTLFPLSEEGVHTQLISREMIYAGEINANLAHDIQDIPGKTIESPLLLFYPFTSGRVGYDEIVGAGGKKLKLVTAEEFIRCITFEEMNSQGWRCGAAFSYITSLPCQRRIALYWS